MTPPRYDMCIARSWYLRNAPGVLLSDELSRPDVLHLAGVTWEGRDALDHPALIGLPPHIPVHLLMTVVDHDLGPCIRITSFRGAAYPNFRRCSPERSSVWPGGPGCYTSGSGYRRGGPRWHGGCLVERGCPHAAAHLRLLLPEGDARRPHRIGDAARAQLPRYNTHLRSAHS